MNAKELEVIKNNPWMKGMTEKMKDFLFKKCWEHSPKNDSVEFFSYFEFHLRDLLNILRDEVKVKNEKTNSEPLIYSNIVEYLEDYFYNELEKEFDRELEEQRGDKLMRLHIFVKKIRDEKNNRIPSKAMAVIGSEEELLVVLPRILPRVYACYRQ